MDYGFICIMRLHNIYIYIYIYKLKICIINLLLKITTHIIMQFAHHDDINIKTRGRSKGMFDKHLFRHSCSCIDCASDESLWRIAQQYEASGIDYM